MSIISPLLTDLYQFTMAYGYWKLGMADQKAVFHLFFRAHPFKGNYAVSCGLTHVIKFLKSFSFTSDDIAYLASLETSKKTRLFSEDFFEYLQNIKFTCDVDAIPEGNVVFPHEPLLRVKGPIIQCQLIETALVNLLNYCSLIATKASRVYFAAKQDSVIEFGARRAHGPCGALMASRSAYVGGCDSTSNTWAGKEFGIPVKGTVAHSWVMAFEDEKNAFDNYAKVMPNNSILLVDTYNTIEGIKKAIETGKKLREKGHELMGIRLDSGDLETLSKQGRKLLDKAGFENTKIVASGDLEENKIALLKEKKAPIDVWGVGTKLTTSYDQPSLDMAYKLSAMKSKNQWRYIIKLSDTPEKTTNPGIQQVRRYMHQQRFIKDVIYDVHLGHEKTLPENADHSYDLCVPIFKKGKLVYEQPSLISIRDYCISEIIKFKKSDVKDYPVLLDKKLEQEKKKLISKLS